MELYKASNFLNDSAVSKFVTKGWIEVNDLPGSQYSVNKNIRFQTAMLRSDLCNYSVIKVSYIVIKGEVTVKGDNKANRRNRK